jgi:hypothetical protein
LPDGIQQIVAEPAEASHDVVEEQGSALREQLPDALRQFAFGLGGRGG